MASFIGRLFQRSSGRVWFHHTPPVPLIYPGFLLTSFAMQSYVVYRQHRLSDSVKKLTERADGIIKAWNDYAKEMEDWCKTNDTANEEVSIDQEVGRILCGAGTARDVDKEECSAGTEQPVLDYIRTRRPLILAAPDEGWSPEEVQTLFEAARKAGCQELELCTCDDDGDESCK